MDSVIFVFKLWMCVRVEYKLLNKMPFKLWDHTGVYLRICIVYCICKWLRQTNSSVLEFLAIVIQSARMEGWCGLQEVDCRSIYRVIQLYNLCSINVPKMAYYGLIYQHFAYYSFCVWKLSTLHSTKKVLGLFVDR